MLPYTWLEEAAQRIKPHIRHTPLTFDSQEEIFLKWENRQVTGSFKARGAINKVLALQPWELERGLVTASAGNHGQGVALAAKLIGVPVMVFAPEGTAAVKLEAIQALGAELRLIKGGFGEAEVAALEYCTAKGLTWVSGYNDPQVIAGQGTLAMEALADLKMTGPREGLVWVVPAGGGGLISGIGAVLKGRGPGEFPDTRPEDPSERVSTQLIGVQPEASAFLHHLFYFGTQEGAVDLPSLAEGLAGPVEAGSLTIPLTREFVDEMVLVTEAELRQAIRYAWEKYRERIEGSAAASLAAVLTGRVKRRPALVVITGGNIQPELHERIVSGGW